jgi:glycosyltransferase involved in cell wall biosynthesis
MSKFPPRRILVVNWRDPEHPKAGGAEALTVRWARAWQELGSEVTLLTNRFEGAAPSAVVEGVPVVRRGNPYNQAWHAFRYDRRHGPFDLVVEEINTLPFFSSLWARDRAVLLMFQLAREVWFYEAPRGMGRLGYSVEPTYLRTYRRQPALTISASTRDDLIGLGFPAERVHIIPVAADVPAGPTPSKTAFPSFVFVGRLAPSKRVDHTIRAFGLAAQDLGSGARLFIVGGGPEEASLRALAQELGVGQAVEFCGRVGDDRRTELLAQAHSLVMASAREGWGLVVTEAGAVATMSIGYPVPGLRDAITHEVTGLLAGGETQAELAHAMVQVGKDPALCRQLSAAAHERARSLTWDRSCQEAVAALQRCVDQLAPAHPVVES